jgi:DNA primase
MDLNWHLRIGILHYRHQLLLLQLESQIMNVFTYLKQRVAILDVIGEYVSLKKAGLYFKGHCPFHHEKTASFTVSPHKEIFYCFGCHEGGDVITFIGKVENCTPFEAIKHLADRYNIDIPESMLKEARSSESNEDKNRYFDLCEMVADWCTQNLKKNPSVMQYVLQRNITPESTTHFSIGYFPGGLQAINRLLAFARAQNILADDLMDANILAQGKTVLYSPFEERIIFPIKDHLGRFCGFGGRRFKELDERAKYYNSRENQYFVKGSILFGLDSAKKSIQEKESVFLVEGYTDCIAMVQHGYPNTVATLGTACTSTHLKTLSRYAQRLIVLYDGDKAGQDAILRLTELCWQVSMELSVICMPAGQDPASYVETDTHIPGQFNDPNMAQDIFDFFIGTLGTNYASKGLGEKLKIARKIIAIIHKQEDALKQDILLQKTSKALDIPFSSLKQELDEFRDTPAPAQVEAPQSLEESHLTMEQGLPRLEKMIFFAIMNNIQLLSRENEEYLLEYLPKPLNTLLATLKAAQMSNPELTFTEYYGMLGTEEQLFISKLLLEGELEPIQKDFDQLMIQLQKKHWKEIVSGIKTKLAQAKREDDTERMNSIMRDFLELKQKMVEKKLI